MYDCSNAFHQAVESDNPQKALLIFSDCVFTDDDISVDEGISFYDYFNTDENLGIGQTTSNHITFSLFNDDRLLNNYEFGDFVATIGVLLYSQTYVQTGTVKVVTNRATYVGSDTYPFITRDGGVLSPQPSFAVKSILAYDGVVYVFGGNGQSAAYDDASGVNVSGMYPVNAFMKNKSKSWAGKGIWYNKDSRYLFIYEAGQKDVYEFVPLGEFHADRPNAPDMIRLNFECFDKMERFDDDMPTAEAMGITYPITIGGLFEALCRYAGVPYESSEFINSSAMINTEPEDFKRCTMREVMRWIAEAAGSNARINRDGILELAWIRDTGQSYNVGDYSDFNPYWYETKPVSNLCNRSTMDNTDYTVGGGSDNYLIQDNPLLRGVT